MWISTHHGVRSANLKDMLHATTTGRKLLRLLAPVRHLLVVNHVVRTERLKLLALLCRRRCRNDLCTSSFGELHSKHTDTASSLGENPFAGLKTTALQAVQAVPRREAGTAESAALQEVEVRGHGDETLLVEGAVLLQGAVDGAADAGGHAVEIQTTGQMTLVEERENFVALLEAGYARADFFDDTCAVRGWDYAGALSEGVEALDNGEVAVVE